MRKDLYFAQATFKRVFILTCRNFIVVFLIIYSPFTFAQEIIWQNAIGGMSNDQLWSMKPTADGGYICGGLSDSPASGDKTESSHGQQDYWIIKLDSLGNIQWQNDIGGSLQDYFTYIELTADGGYICGGSSTSGISGEKTVPSLGSWDYYIVKLDSIGNIQWQKSIGGSNVDELQCIKQTTDGGYICAGDSRSNISSDKSENCIGLDDYWIVKLNSIGDIEWENTIGGSSYDAISSIVQTPDGGYICGGTSGSDISIDKSENCLGGYDYWIIKLTNSGTIEWENTIGSSSTEHFTELNLTSDGGVILAGMSGSPKSEDKKEDSQGSHDIWVVKLSSYGLIDWENTIGGLESDYAYSIQQSSDGGYICGGYSESGISGDKNQISYGDKDYWIVKLDEDGRLIWQNTSGGTDRDEIRSVCEDNQGQYMCGGWTYSGQSGNKSEASQGGIDYWILKINNRYNIITGVQYFDANSNGIQDIVEPGIAYKKVEETVSGNFTFSDPNGFYSLVVNDTGNFVVSPLINSSYFSSSPVSQTATFNTLFNVDSLNDFAYQAIGSFMDLCITITPVGQFRSGMNATYILSYSNNGNTTQSPIVIFYPDQNVDFISSIPSANFISQDSITFAIGTLSPFQNGQIIITVNIDTGLPIGTVINSGALILPVVNDINPQCNSMYWEVLITGSYDPNDILVNRNSLYDFETITPPFLEYLIRFQNTGNDTAFYVSVENKIENKLQISSFELINTSHPCQTEYRSSDSTMKFVFTNILLPDSNINESRSHGFIRYRIKPQSNLIVGDSIFNKAGITFDYNASILTNTAVTEIVMPTFINEELKYSINFYPNPFVNEITIEQNGKGNQTVFIDICNVYGQVVKSLHSGIVESENWKMNFDLGELPSGIYVLTISGNETITKKLIKL